MSKQTTPVSITPFILKSARAISKHQPAFVDLVVYPGMKPRMCFQNVESLVEKRGGRSVMGWIFWEWPGVMIDAEHHAIWERPDGVWEDVTPKADGETRVLFVRDDTALYVNDRCLINKGFPAPDNPLARKFIGLKEEAEKVIFPYRRTGHYEVPEDVVHLYRRKSDVAERVWKKLVAAYP